MLDSPEPNTPLTLHNPEQTPSGTSGIPEPSSSTPKDSSEHARLNPARSESKQTGISASMYTSKSSHPKKRSQPVRAINEDDDGYDPYSDYHDAPVREPLFERDPWE